MPLYEYQCEECGRRTEVIQRVGAPPIGPCEECAGEMRKLLSAPAFQFKGTGWYVTDYANKSGAGSSSSGDAKRETSDSKPAETAKKKESSDSGSKKSE